MLIRKRLGSYLWGVSGLTLAIGFVLHPPLTVEGMLTPIWVPDHYLIMVSLFALVFALGSITYERPEAVNKLGWTGFVFLNFSAFLFIGIVYFEVFLIPILARDLPELFTEGLRIGPLKAVLPVTALLFVVGHVCYGVALIRKNLLPLVPFTAMILFSAPLSFKPVLPDIVATLGAVGYGIAALLFAVQYPKQGEADPE